MMKKQFEEGVAHGRSLADVAKKQATEELKERHEKEIDQMQKPYADMKE